MYKKSEEFEIRPKIDFFLIISLIVLMVITVVFFFAATYYYRKRAKDISLSENRFLTTEWRLLKELKAQSDQKLLDKEKEIAELNKRFLALASGNASSWELQQMEIRLQQAKAEYEEILSSRIDATSEINQDQKEWIAELLPSGDQSAITKILEEQIKTLDEKLEESRLHIRGLENEIKSLMVQQENLNREYANTITEKRTEIKKLISSLTGLKQAIHDAYEEIEQKVREIDIPDHPSIEDLNTRALVRAIISSPAVQTTYPGLLESLDRYFKVYGLQEYLKGQKEALTRAAETLKPVTREPTTP